MDLSVKIALYLSALNVLTLFAFGVDKRQAELSDWRLRESRLLFLAAVGGSIGAKFGQRIFRHKTRKEPFRTQLNAIVVLQILLLAFMSTPGATERVKDTLQLLAQSPESAPAQRQMPVRFGPGSGF